MKRLIFKLIIYQILIVLYIAFVILGTIGWYCRLRENSAIFILIGAAGIEAVIVYDIYYIGKTVEKIKKKGEKEDDI